MSEFSRRDLLKSSALITSAVGLAGCATDDPSPAQPPNIIVLVTDDQRWDMLGAAGNPLIQDPAHGSLGHGGGVVPEPLRHHVPVRSVANLDLYRPLCELPWHARLRNADVGGSARAQLSGTPARSRLPNRLCRQVWCRPHLAGRRVQLL